MEQVKQLIKRGMNMRKAEPVNTMVICLINKNLLLMQETLATRKAKPLREQTKVCQGDQAHNTKMMFDILGISDFIFNFVYSSNILPGFAFDGCI